MNRQVTRYQRSNYKQYRGVNYCVRRYLAQPPPAPDILHISTSTHPLVQPLGYTAHLHHKLTLWHSPSGYTVHLHHVLIPLAQTLGYTATSTMYSPSDTAPEIHCTPPPHTPSVVGCTRREVRAPRPATPPRRNSGPYAKQKNQCH